MINVKKMLALFIPLSLTFVFWGCNPSSDSGSGANTYIRAEVLDSDHVALYSSSTELEQIPVLNLQDDYYLSLHIGPGARVLPYEYTTIAYEESEMIVQEIEDRAGQLYILRGLTECQNSKIEIEAYDTKDVKIQCYIYVNFS